MIDLFTLAAARKYADAQISSVIGGLPPSTYDTIKEIGDYLDTHENAYQALVTILQNKINEPDTAGTLGQILSLTSDGEGGLKTIWRDETSSQDITIDTRSGATIGTEQEPLVMNSNTEYRLTGGSESPNEGTISSLAIALPSTVPNDYTSIIHFSTGDTAPTILLPNNNNVIFSGSDISIGTVNNVTGYEFDVQTNTRYTIAFENDGTYIRGFIVGTELIIGS